MELGLASGSLGHLTRDAQSRNHMPVAAWRRMPGSAH